MLVRPKKKTILAISWKSNGDNFLGLCRTCTYRLGRDHYMSILREHSDTFARRCERKKNTKKVAKAYLNNQQFLTSPAFFLNFVQMPLTTMRSIFPFSSLANKTFLKYSGLELINTFSQLYLKHLDRSQLSIYHTFKKIGPAHPHRQYLCQHVRNFPYYQKITITTADTNKSDSFVTHNLIDVSRDIVKLTTHNPQLERST